MSPEQGYFGPLGVDLKKSNFLIRIFSKSLQCQDWSKKRQSKAQMGNSCLQYRRHCSTTHRVRDGKMCIYMIVLIFNAEAKRLSFSSPGDKMIKWQQYVLISKNLECWGQTACFILWPKVNMMHKMYLKAVSSDISSLGKQMIRLWRISTVW